MLLTVRDIFSLAYWFMSGKFLRGSRSYYLNKDWEGYIVPWIKDTSIVSNETNNASWWSFYKALTYVHSKANYIHDSNEEDYWFTPEEFYSRGGGDCEDWASAILFKAIEYGVDLNNIGWVYLLEESTGNGHIMCGMWRNGELWLADNNRKIPERASKILLTEWKTYTPIAWFNGKENKTLI